MTLFWSRLRLRRRRSVFLPDAFSFSIAARLPLRAARIRIFFFVGVLLGNFDMEEAVC